MTGSRSGPAGPKATIQDVADAAGVGRQTVSNVLNGSGRVGDAARARVLGAVASLGYQPHHGARSLRSRRTRQLAYVMPRAQLQPANLIMLQFLRSLAAASAKRHYSVVIVVPDGDPRDDLRRLIASRSVDAFVLSELQPGDPRVELLRDSGMPFACFGRTSPGLPQQWVDIDNHAATAAAVKHVLARGYSRPAYVGYGSAQQWDTDRAAGFLAGLAGRGPAADEAEVLLVDDAAAAESGVRRQIRSLIASARPDAVVTGSDRLAAVVYSVAAELRLGIGRDLAVTGFDGSVVAGLLRPRLTSVAIPVDEIARRVVDRALGQLDGGPDLRPGEIVRARLRPGGSTSRGRRRNQALDDPAAGGDNNATLAWKRFQGASAASKGDPLPASRRTTIADVAAAAGVGVGTVSRVLNGSEQVRPATLRTVQEAIDRLGYRPSHAAAALVRGTPRTVAVVVTHVTRPSAVVRVAGALAVLEEQGYDTIVCNVESPLERDRQLEALLTAHRADGVLAISVPLSREQLAKFSRAGVALVTVDTAAAGVPHTVIDDVAGGQLATGHLIALGHRRIGFVGDEVSRKLPAGLGFTSSDRRLQGYQRALAAAGIGPDAGLVRRGPHAAAAAAELAARLLKSPDPPSAIFAASDTQAMGVLAAADRLGVQVPGQLSVIGFDDIEAAALIGLSTIRQPLERSGADGARRLCALLRGERISPLRQQLALEVVPRASSARYQGPGPYSPDTDIGVPPRPAAAATRPGNQSPPTNTHGVT
jgi:LacI family transcriptional regulator